jgi:Fic family protein
MQPEDFTSSIGGRLINIGSNRWAFVPHPLPPMLEWHGILLNTLSDADRAIGQLAAWGGALPGFDPYLLVRPFVNREAVLSSRIEGTQTSITDLYALEAEQPFDSEHRREDAIEVRNYVRALEHGLERRKTLPVSLRLLREMHAILMDGARGAKRDPGEFRRSQVWIGGTGAKLEQASFVPPPPGQELETALAELERFIHGPSDLPPLVRIALIHHQFEAIHPFLDGNGRIGRLLIALLLVEWQILPQPLLYLSAFFERHRRLYYDHLLAVSTRGTWREWLEFFLEGVAFEARDASIRLSQLSQLQREYRERFSGMTVNALRAIDSLFGQPIITVRQLERTLGLTFEATRRIVTRLEEADILFEITGRKRDRLYAAKEIIQVLERDSSTLQENQN